MSANNVDPNTVGVFLVAMVVGIFVLYALIDYEKKHHYSTSYSTRRIPRGYQVPSDSEDNEEDDAFKAGYQNERGRQAALAEARHKD